MKTVPLDSNFETEMKIYEFLLKWQGITSLPHYKLGINLIRNSNKNHEVIHSNHSSYFLSKHDIYSIKSHKVNVTLALPTTSNRNQRKNNEINIFENLNTCT